jgi:hypothetical protein
MNWITLEGRASGLVEALLIYLYGDNEENDEKPQSE